MHTDLTRRRVLLGLAGLLLPVSGNASGVWMPTPRQTAGPFYPAELPLDDDNELTRVAGRDAPAKGHATDLTGRILDTSGRALRHMRIEIWQCDAHGRYRHPRDRGGAAIDANFQGHGRTVSDGQGRYRFRTIRPVPYPGRTPHIHVAVFPRGTPPFTTQLYIKGEPRNQTDFLFRRVPAERRHLVVADFVAAGPHGDAELQARFDLVLGGNHGTPSA